MIADRGPCACGHLRHAVLPVVLAGAAHHEQVAVAELPADCDGPPAFGRSWNGRGVPMLTMATTRVLVLEALTVGVPGDRVAAVAVEVEPDRVERPVVVLR